MATHQNQSSKLFEPLVINNGNLTLDHRVIHAPMTRNRGVPLNENSTPENPNRIWYPGDLMVEYYRQRATKGGLIISEGIPPSLEVRIAYFTLFPDSSESNSWFCPVEQWHARRPRPVHP